MLLGNVQQPCHGLNILPFHFLKCLSFFLQGFPVRQGVERLFHRLVQVFPGDVSQVDAAPGPQIFEEGADLGVVGDTHQGHAAH